MLKNNRNSYWIQRTHIFRSDEYECASCGCKSSKPFKTCPSCYRSMSGSDYDPTWVDEIDIMDDLFN
ncbi:MAG: hypothetical protein KBS79_04240 [Lachnospiraceae bacterium]|nr:hypothetical protein [Candidatus Minthocola equi]